MVDIVDDEGWQRVAARIAQEIRERGLVPNDVYRQSGVDPKTLARLLNGDGIKRAAPARKLAAMFGWRADALERIRDGEEPIIVTEAATIEDRLAAVERAVREVRSAMEAIESRLDAQYGQR